MTSNIFALRFPIGLLRSLYPNERPEVLLLNFHDGLRSGRIGLEPTSWNIVIFRKLVNWLLAG
jgi:hypothetical protein